MRARWPVLVFALAVACDRTPPEVARIADERLPQLRAFAERMQAHCVGAGPEAKVDDWDGLDEDPAVLNVKVTCKSVNGLGFPVTLPTLRPEPEGDKSGTPYRVGVSKDKEHAEDPFPLEQATKPSFLTTETDSLDLCVATGHPDDPDYTEVCVAFKATPS